MNEVICDFGFAICDLATLAAEMREAAITAVSSLASIIDLRFAAARSNRKSQI
jgi:hypothetical protein